MNKFSFLFALLLATTNIFAQHNEFLIELDPATGTFIKKGGPITGIHWIYPDTRAYDEVNGRMIFQGGDPTPDHLYSVNVTNGSIVSYPAFPASWGSSAVREPRFDNSTQTLYGLYQDTPTYYYYLATIDPVTGVHTVLGSTPIAGLSGTNQGMATFDQIHHRYILCSANKIYTVDAVTGVAVDTPLTLQTGTVLLHLRYNNTNDTLYGLLKNGAQYHLVRIDPITGVVTTIGNGTAFGYGNGTGTIDEAGRRYMYCYSVQGDFHLSVMGLDSGNIIFNNQIPLDSFDNVHNLEYDNVKQKLFAVHWDHNITTTNIPEMPDLPVIIYPDPASEKLSVRFAKSYPDLDIALYNVTGQFVRSFHLQQAHECTLQLDDLSAGSYFLEFEAPGENFSVRFVKQ